MRWRDSWNSGSSTVTFCCEHGNNVSYSVKSRYVFTSCSTVSLSWNTLHHGADSQRVVYTLEVLIAIWVIKVERRSPQLSTPFSYSGGSDFESWLGDRVSWLRFFIVFPGSSRQMIGYCLKFDHDHFLPHIFSLLFTNYPVIEGCMVRARNSTVKYTANKRITNINYL